MVDRKSSLNSSRAEGAQPGFTGTSWKSNQGGDGGGLGVTCSVLLWFEHKILRASLQAVGIPRSVVVLGLHSFTSGGCGSSEELGMQ